MLIQAFGAGNLPMGRADLGAALGDARDRRLPVVVISQCPYGGVDLSAYELGRKIGAMGAISGGFHTRWAALAKLGLVLGAGGGMEEAQAAFGVSWAGEPMPDGAWSQS
jgi:L-asparaginase/Glu-tRNA(Gln) amidotransferase subunit D